MAPVRVQAFCSGMHFKHSWTAKVTRRWVGRSRWDASKKVDIFFFQYLRFLHTQMTLKNKKYS